MISTLSNDKLSAVAATACSGLATGCLLFVSAVDVRSFVKHIKDKDTNIIQRHFPVWWPNGRDLMVPLALSGTAANSLAFFQTQNRHFAISAGLMFSLLPYTAIVLGEDIDALRQSNPTKVEEKTIRFGNLHHVRTLAAALAFGLSLVALAEL